MRKNWQIVVDWEALDEGSAEERSCFAALGIQANDVWLTEGRDSLANRLRNAPFLSAYHFAEWVAWNWWRLRWEPRGSSETWSFAHRTRNIGAGYIWPNIEIFSDGERTALLARPTAAGRDTPFQYIANASVIIPSLEFEAGLDDFLEQVLQRLDSEIVANSNLSKLWTDVLMERSDPQLAFVRKIEALLGFDPDRLHEEVATLLKENADDIGISATEELAADHGRDLESNIISAKQLPQIANNVGFASCVQDIARLTGVPKQAGPRNQLPAWRLGASFAKALREEEDLHDDVITNQRLALMLALDERAIESRDSTALGISFLFKDNKNDGRVVLRSKWQTGRRFEVARLLGDRLMNADEKLFPATRAYTYRQKAQRSFAAELLSPFLSIVNMLRGDFSQEKILDVSEHFNVSEITIRTQLVNHGILEREELDPDILAAA